MTFEKDTCGGTAFCEVEGAPIVPSLSDRFLDYWGHSQGSYMLPWNVPPHPGTFYPHTVRNLGPFDNAFFVFRAARSQHEMRRPIHCNLVLTTRQLPPSRWPSTPPPLFEPFLVILAAKLQSMPANRGKRVDFSSQVRRCYQFAERSVA